MTIKRKLTAGFGILLLLFVIFSIVVLDDMAGVEEQFSFVVKHDAPVIANANRLLKLVVDMETSQRGFGITQKEDFLEPFNLANNEFHKLIETEKELISDNPSQVKVLERIHDLLHQWEAKAAKPEIAMARKVAASKEMKEQYKAQKALAALLEAGTGKALIDEIRVEFANFIKTEEELTKQRYADACQTTRDARKMILFLVVLSIIFGSTIAAVSIRAIISSIGKLLNGTKIIGSGDLTHRIEIKSKDEIGQLAVSFNRMVNNLQQAEEQLLESERKFRAVAETAVNAIISSGSEGKIIFWNEAAEKMFGYAREEIIGKEIKAIMPEKYRSAHLKGLKRVVETGKTRIVSRPVEMAGLRKDGTEFPLELILSKWQTEGGVFFTAMISDITKRKEAEKERDNILKMLESKNNELQSIVYVASHDLRSPLINITGFGTELSNSCQELQALLQNIDAGTNEKTKIETLLKEHIPESLGFIIAATNKIQMLLDGLLQVSRVGTAVINIEQVDVNNLFTQVLKTAQFKIREYGATVDIDDDLPDCLGDIAKTSQVFSNLVDNALKFLAPNRDGKIHISGRTENKMSVYCVEDNGIGIDPAHHERIFEVFHRLDPDDAVGGEGLGLSIVMRIVDRLNGSIRVESEPGKGSSFFVSLPTLEA